MLAATTQDLLATWERGTDPSHVGRALALAAVALPGATYEQLAALPLGARDAELMKFRRSLFGDTLSAVACCPHCNERIELTVEVSALCHSTYGADIYNTLCTQSGRYEIAYRVPNSHDVLAIRGLSCSSQARQALLARCIVALTEDGAPSSLEALPSDVETALCAALAQADPGAVIELLLACPACERRCEAPFDITDFLWTEVDAWAQRTLADIHTLARAYGWSEAEILSLGARRRQFYLELVRA